MFGIAVSAWGTYLMTLSLHPFDWDGFRDFVVDSPRFALALLEEQRMKISDMSRANARTLKNLETLSKLGSVNPERRDISLVGVGLLFIGFVLQAVGLIWSMVDFALMQYFHVPGI
jgi:hypothetical protein